VIAARFVPLGLLLAYAAAFGAAAFGGSLPAFDDHPGQLYRLWHVVVHGPAPWAWDPGWWTGYPELQFYPPGFFYLGALLHAAFDVGGFELVPLAAAYQALLWLTYLAPGLAAFALLARVLGSGWAALPGAFVALTLSAGVASGVEGGVHVGMLPARLGWALLPVLALVVLRRAGDAAGPPWLAVPLAAGIVLVHPAHLPAAVVLVLLGASSGGIRARRLLRAAVILLLAATLTLFWTLPLLVRLDHARALAWGTLPRPSMLLGHPLLLLLLALAAIAPRLTRSRAERVVARWPFIMLAVVGAAALVEPLGWRWLPADRIADSAWLAVVVAAGLVLGRLADVAGRRLRLPRGAPALATLAALTVLSLPGPTLALWPRGAEWPALRSVERDARLGELWPALAAQPGGRVLFVRSGVPLVAGTAWWRPHSHVTALTPIRAGREIVNGTFTHPSPVAALLYRGAAGPGAIGGLAEQLDGHSLFGRPLESLDAAALDRWTDRLGVSVIVALDEDLPRLRVLDGGAGFERRPPVGPFVLFARGEPRLVPERTSAGGWRLVVNGAAGAWVSARVAYYPLWRAERGGVRLPTRRGEAGDLEVMPDRTRGAVDLIYAAGTVEKLGVGLSIAGLAVWLALGGASGLARRARRQREASADRRADTRATPAAS
jgi:hypothetical protein